LNVVESGSCWLCHIAEVLQAASVRVIVTRQSVDTGATTGGSSSTSASSAAFERELIREQIATGLERTRRRGHRFRRPEVLDRERKAPARRLRAHDAPVNGKRPQTAYWHTSSRPGRFR
jgi:DNA invertase Pin-like site-specific DNA recombinase